jgi:hypothetical protein
MLKKTSRVAGVLLGSAILWGPSLCAETLVQKMSLDEISQRADKIFRGTVVGITTGVVEAGGGELPTVTYRIEIKEAFRGTYANEGGARVTEITMLGRLKPVTVNGTRSSSYLLQLPVLKIGQSYVLLTAPPSAIGLSSPIGLGQGCFTVFEQDGNEMVKNAAGKTMTYNELSAAIRSATR